MVSNMFYLHRGRWSQNDIDSMYFQSPGPWVYFEWIIPFFQGSESTSPYISMAWQTQRLQQLIRGYHFFSLVSSQQLRRCINSFLTENHRKIFLIQTYSNLFIFFLVKQKQPLFVILCMFLDVCVSLSTKWNSYAENSPHPGMMNSWVKGSLSWWDLTLESMDVVGTKMAILYLLASIATWMSQEVSKWIVNGL